MAERRLCLGFSGSLRSATVGPAVTIAEMGGPVPKRTSTRVLAPRVTLAEMAGHIRRNTQAGHTLVELAVRCRATGRATGLWPLMPSDRRPRSVSCFLENHEVVRTSALHAMVLAASATDRDRLRSVRHDGPACQAIHPSWRIPCSAEGTIGHGGSVCDGPEEPGRWRT